MLKTKGITGSQVTKFFVNNAIVFLLIFISISVGLLRDNFFSIANFSNLVGNTAIRFIIALGVSGCLIAAGPDLSAGRQVGLAACIAATFLQRVDFANKVYPQIGDLPIIFVLAGAMLACGIFGLLNGLVVAYLKVPPFIVTLGMMTIVYGICLVFTGAQPIGALRPDYMYLANNPLFGIPWLPYLGVYAAIIGGIIWFIYNKTSHGKYMYAIGGNEHAAEVSGINVNRTKVIIFASAGLLYGVAGFLLAAKSGAASVNMGFSYELEAIAGCTIGGVSTTGGVGRVSGILIGVLVFELLKIAMQFMGIETSYTFIVQGLVIILAVALDMRKHLAKR
jgi:methyl-galactoside transport system permease protein